MDERQNQHTTTLPTNTLSKELSSSSQTTHQQDSMDLEKKKEIEVNSTVSLKETYEMRIADLIKSYEDRIEDVKAFSDQRVADLKKLYEERFADLKRLYEERLAELRINQK